MKKFLMALMAVLFLGATSMVLADDAAGTTKPADSTNAPAAKPMKKAHKGHKGHKGMKKATPAAASEPAK